jgi:hypothetical protein
MRYAISSIILIVFSGFISFSQQDILVERSLVVNIEVPVRVFKDGKFVDNLKLKDFEIWEDGVPHKIEAVYLIKKDTVERKEETKTQFKPQTERTFFLLFEMHEYDPRVSKSIDEFVQNVLLAKDNLIAVTPVNTYRLKDKGLEIKPREEIAKELKSLLRKDIISGSGEYRSALHDIEEVARVITSAFVPSEDKARILSHISDGRGVMGLELDLAITLYIAYLEKLEVLREVNQRRLLDFAGYLKEREGQNNVFFFYQREFIPQIDPKYLIQNESMFQELGGDISILLKNANTQYRDVTVDIKKLKEAYADASTAIHFMYITRQPKVVPGVYFAERSSDIFTPFLEMSKASGGFAESSANPDYLFKNALAASENYYLVYYAPKNYRGDGKFKNIKVRVKGKGYKVVHRLGYFSN